MKALAVIATIGLFIAGPVRADSPAVLVFTHPIEPNRDYLCMTNQDGKFVDYRGDAVDAGGCVLTRTQIDASGDRDLDVWECLENNENPGVDQRHVLTNTEGDPLTEPRKTNGGKKYTPIP